MVADDKNEAVNYYTWVFMRELVGFVGGNCVRSADSGAVWFDYR